MFGHCFWDIHKRWQPFYIIIIYLYFQNAMIYSVLLVLSKIIGRQIGQQLGFNME